MATPIDPSRSPPVRPGPSGTAPEAHVRGAGRPEAPPRGDVVEISEDARALAGKIDPDRPPLTESRLEEVRDRLDAGFYARHEVLDHIARRILDSGDL